MWNVVCINANLKWVVVTWCRESKPSNMQIPESNVDGATLTEPQIKSSERQVQKIQKKILWAGKPLLSFFLIGHFLTCSASNMNNSFAGVQGIKMAILKSHFETSDKRLNIWYASRIKVHFGLFKNKIAKMAYKCGLIAQFKIILNRFKHTLFYTILFYKRCPSGLFWSVAKCNTKYLLTSFYGHSSLKHNIYLRAYGGLCKYTPRFTSVLLDYCSNM